MTRFNTASGKHCCNCIIKDERGLTKAVSFNTASGKHCCNFKMLAIEVAKSLPVSIPQAVSTVATRQVSVHTILLAVVSIPQAVSTVATLINMYLMMYKEI